MSVEDPPEQTMHHVAARIIQKTWRSYMNREVFKYFKELIHLCNQGDPQMILKTVNPREAELLDAAAGVFLRFRLGGTSFPPNIYYKIFTYRPVADMCASSPQDYTKLGQRKPEDQTGWYRRTENNGWRLFCNKMLPKDEPTVIGADKKLDFHYSKLQRRQDVDRWRKRRKVEWLRHMYRRGRQQSEPATDAPEENGDEEEQEVELEEQEEQEGLEELLTWSNTVNFEEYLIHWSRLACSLASEPTKDPCGFPGSATEN